LKKDNLDIFATFDIFNSEAMSIIKDRVVRFVLVESGGISGHESCITANADNNNVIHISVLNNEKVYNLLTASWNRYNHGI